MNIKILIFCISLHMCTSQERLDEHTQRCKTFGLQNARCPEKNDKKGKDKVKFTWIL